VQNTKDVRMREGICNTRVHFDTYADKVKQKNIQGTVQEGLLYRRYDRPPGHPRVKISPLRIAG